MKNIIFYRRYYFKGDTIRTLIILIVIDKFNLREEFRLYKASNKQKEPNIEKKAIKNKNKNIEKGELISKDKKQSILNKKEDIINIGPQSDIEINQDNKIKKAIKENNIYV